MNVENANMKLDCMYRTEVLRTREYVIFQLPAVVKTRLVENAPSEKPPC